MQGIPGTGFYGKIRTLTDMINTDQYALDHNPLGPIQRKRLEKRVADLRELRIAIRKELTEKQNRFWDED